MIDVSILEVLMIPDNIEAHLDGQIDLRYSILSNLGKNFRIYT
jgi:hypothetical protein